MGLPVLPDQVDPPVQSQGGQQRPRPSMRFRHISTDPDGTSIRFTNPFHRFVRRTQEIHELQNSSDQPSPTSSTVRFGIREAIQELQRIESIGDIHSPLRHDVNRVVQIFLDQFSRYLQRARATGATVRGSDSSDIRNIFNVSGREERAPNNVSNVDVNGNPVSPEQQGFPNNESANSFVNLTASVMRQLETFDDMLDRMQVGQELLRNSVRLLVTRSNFASNSDNFSPLWGVANLSDDDSTSVPIRSNRQNSANVSNNDVTSLLESLLTRSPRMFSSRSQVNSSNETSTNNNVIVNTSATSVPEIQISPSETFVSNQNDSRPIWSTLREAASQAISISPTLQPRNITANGSSDNISPLSPSLLPRHASNFSPGFGQIRRSSISRLESLPAPEFDLSSDSGLNNRRVRQRRH